MSLSSRRFVTAAPTSVRGFQGIPQRDIHFMATFVRSYTQEFEKLDRLRQQVEAGKVTLRVAEVYPPKRAADVPRRLEAAWCERTAAHPILILPETRHNGNETHSDDRKTQDIKVAGSEIRPV